MIPALISAMRPRQWVKNAFVLAPLVFSGEAQRSDAVLRALGAVAVFCLAASAIYLVNDVVDREADRAHPTKRNRPIAAGRVSPTTALTAAGALMGGAIGLALAIHWRLGVIAAAYVLISIAYSVWLKHIVIIDVFTVASGFVLRVLGGAAAIVVEPSIWLIICMGFLALMLGFGKRRGEARLLADGGVDHRAVLAHYTPAFADAMVILTAGLALAAYAAYSATGRPAERHMAVTLPFVMYGVFRYLWLIFHRDRGDSPTELALSDPAIIAAVVAWGAAAATLMAI